jgi:uncharacterized protein YndB with AHSA1/START domain
MHPELARADRELLEDGRIWLNGNHRREDGGIAMSTDSHTPVSDGVMEVREDGKYVLRFERRLPHPPEEVWRALTEPDQLRQWFPAAIEGERKLGARIRFVFREDAPSADELPELLEHDPETMEGEITELDRPRLFAYTWGDEALRWELRRDGDDCLLSFTATFDERGGNIPHPAGPRRKGARDASGWHLCLDALEALLDGKASDADAPEDDRWRQLYEGYVKAFD